MAATANPITQQQFLVTIKGIDSYWEKFSGIKDKADTTDYNDGLSNRKFKLVGPRELEEMDLEKAFDPIADKPIIDFWRNYCDDNKDVITISITPVTYCPEVEPIGPSVIVYKARPTALEGFEVDKKSNDISMLKLTFIADDWEYA
ncbi:hypothetical protein VF14_08995 [Nostoc linckia z18]|uniref:Uncharacterized protein n=2 Tax=Nostoc linckia TaxID=92942 RepID=A0A9Q5ZEN4_NOSLI|nr:hypothetical protein [Nostoc linckia]PHK32501.1 hypothetical protein VF12_26635 [Nostoc linckia z15]PHK44553.1 hypothetical protein VF13_21345 [Nostoc linckia z16]PHJ59597.1 hypothetical protein VF02_24620 [Nostoc linckia z1]PHJ65125.1 hypothetical protein VF05_21530 [Nostoc linckia z3]PHJ69602.1 hypothetical protein VF03_23700 [Nostoc linckia z2]